MIDPQVDMFDPEADEQCSSREQNAADVRVQSAGDEVSRGQGSSHSRAVQSICRWEWRNSGRKLGKPTGDGGVTTEGGGWRRRRAADGSGGGAGSRSSLAQVVRWRKTDRIFGLGERAYGKELFGPAVTIYCKYYERSGQVQKTIRRLRPKLRDDFCL
jgi:hypothetical protein